MKYALYLGCTIQSDQYGFEASVRETLPKLDVELVDMEDTSCCGFPALSSVSVTGWHYLSARNLAITEKMGLDVLPLCNGCHLSFIETIHALEEDPRLKEIVNRNLEKEGLRYEGTAKVVHLIEVLHDAVGKEGISEKVKKRLEGVKLAAHPGCHAIRPSDLQKVDDAENPQKLDTLIKALGAETFDYPEKIDCCGSQLAVSSGRSTLRIAGEKLQAVQSYGFEGLVTTCPFCFKMYDSRQRAIRGAMRDRSIEVPVFYYTQILGLALGSSPEKLGLQMNQSPVDDIVNKILGDD
ncbi:MAG: CoB--CoM heterodisulfide reductase iron-sulfur subunit B family protein [Candidatus Bathyarchaeota archaeon]|nr:CoB--CoM heterodisulfide reductase iron-sulfur subunit B family protein [Candidatus Bathyarchaeota archaeon]